jgi:hypothetical protein
MFEGSCCCGEVRFRISQKPKFVAACHCSRCRKLGATPFAMVEAETFELLAGRDRIATHRPEPPFKYPRAFCGSCGTSLGELTSSEKMFPIPVNCFDDDPGMEIRFHEHVASRPSWTVIPEGSKVFEGDPG